MPQRHGEQAEAALSQVLTMAQELSNPTKRWKIYEIMGELYEWQTDWERARAAYQSAIDVLNGVAER